jgi:hypothetical protein
MERKLKDVQALPLNEAAGILGVTSTDEAV